MSFLHTLLPELGHKIFSHLLTSPTGIVSLSLTDTELSDAETTDTVHDGLIYIHYLAPPKARRCKILADGDNVISLAFLRTCKQIYHEARDLKALWRNNTVTFDHSSDVIARIPRTVASNVENLKMEMVFGGAERLGNGDGSLELPLDLEYLRRNWRNLKNLTLECWPIAKFNGRPHSVDDLLFLCSIDPGKSHAEDLEALKQAGGEGRFVAFAKEDLC
jgi:hypothetical protein